MSLGCHDVTPIFENRSVEGSEEAKIRILGKNLMPQHGELSTTTWHVKCMDCVLVSFVMLQKEGHDVTSDAVQTYDLLEFLLYLSP